MTPMVEAALGRQLDPLTGLLLITLPVVWYLGRGPERALAKAAAVAIGLSLFFQTLLLSGNAPAPVRPDHALLDFLLLLCAGAVALRANRFYPLVMTSAALIAVLAHGLRWLGLLEGQFGYQVLITVPAFVMLVTLWIGTGLHFRRERRFGRYPDWRGPASAASDCRHAENGLA